MDQERLRAMQFQHPEHIPVSVSLLPATWMKYRDRLDELIRRHPLVFSSRPKSYDDIHNPTYAIGRHVDAWGCVWENVCQGMQAIVTHHPVPTRQSVETLKAPEKDIGLPHGFMYLRLCDLRGFEEVMVDFAEEPPELQRLIDVVLAYNLRQLERELAKVRGKGSQMLYFGDDLGIQHSLPISPAKWRKYLKPCYAKLYGRVREEGHWVYMHTDGHIWEIIPDLIECGVNVLNPQIRANGLDNLVRVCKGNICVNLDLDRQMFPFCTPADIDWHVCQVVEAMGSPEGGLWLTAECAPDVPLENIEAICQALEKHRNHYR